MTPNDDPSAQQPTATAASHRLRAREKICYGFGDLASVLYWQTFMLYLTYFYTDVYGISAGIAGAIFLGSRIWDGVNDPLMGVVADRTETRWGKFRPYLLWMSVPLAVFGVLTFTTPDLSNTGKIIWAICTYVPLMMLYTAINIPYTAMLGVVTSNGKERTQLSSVKFIFAFSAGLLISMFLMPMTKILGDGNPQKGWQLSFIIVGVLAVLFFFITFSGTKERVKPKTTQRTPLKEDLKDLRNNGPWWILVAVTFTWVLFVGIRMSITPHYIKYYAGDLSLMLPFYGQLDLGFEGAVSWFNSFGQAGSIVGVFLVSILAGKLSKKLMFNVTMVIGILCNIGFFFVGPEAFVTMLVLQTIGSLAGGAAPVLLWAMYADTADYSDWKNGRRATGLVFSASTMSQKVGWAISAAGALWILNMTGFVANTDQNPETIQMLVAMMSVIPAACGVVSVIIFHFYPLDEARVSTIEEELAVRQAAYDAESAVTL